MTAGAPSGVVTFLFTDVEGSTRRWEADAEGMRKALAAHDDVLRWAIEAHGGWVFKHTGDGMCAAFGSPRSAVDAAVAAQRELELPVRMGIATGEAELREGDYFGAVLNRAARVMAAEHGGQILVGESTAGLLSGVDLKDLGSRRLRDLSAPIGMFQVRASGLRAEFPPLRTLDATPGNLRAAVTSFVGRESEVAEVQAAVRARRLVTLTGVGGVGKTRLATEVASRLAPEFPDGVWVFELAEVADPAAVPDAVAAALGIMQQPGKSVAESVAAALAGRVRLLVLDNCEHVRDAAGDLVEAVLAASATVRILATSREGLGVADEQLWVVPSLDVAGTDSPAVDLFVERARNVAHRFAAASPDELTAAVEICRRLDGIPLAIELAASRMASMTADEVRDRLDKRFRLLVGSRRGLERHQTLRQAVGWSYDFLDDAEKSLLQTCSVFAGGFDLQSACAVYGSDDEYSTLDLLDALVRKSLLLADRAAGRTRFAMLETIRQFAEEQLVASGRASDARDAHARYFAGRETDIMALWDTPQQREAYKWFRTEVANLRTAFRWAAEAGDLDSAAAIAIYGVILGNLSGNHEPVAWAEELIEPSRAVDHPRLAALYEMATHCYFLGRMEEALRYSEAGQALVNTGRYRKLPFGGEGVLVGPYFALGRHDKVIEWCRAQVQQGRDSHVQSRSMLVANLAAVGSVEEARVAAEGLIEAAEATRNPYVLSLALFAYGYSVRSTAPAVARETLSRGMLLARESGNRWTESTLAVGLASLDAACGDLLAALESVTVGIRNFDAAGNTTMIRAALAVLVTLLDQLRNYEPAAVIAGFAVGALATYVFAEVEVTIAHLRDALGEPAYESLARKGEAMNVAEIAAYAYAQIDQARAELEAVAD